MKSTRSFVLLLAMLCATCIYADSPLTSTYFADVYKNERIVAIAMMAEGEITEEIMNYLADENNPVGIKIATINGLWLGTDNYDTFLNYLKKKHFTSSEITLLADLDASTLISLAYIKALGDYTDLKEAFIIAQNAALKVSDSLTINMINALIYAQMIMTHDFCTVFKVCDRVVKDKTLTQDMQPKAIMQIMEYINLYEDDCNKKAGN